MRSLVLLLPHLVVAAAAADAPLSCSTAGWPATHTLSDRKGWSWSAGNHRFAVRVAKLPPAAGGAVQVTLPWRRSDTGLGDVIVVGAATHLRVRHCTRLNATTTPPAPQGATLHPEESAALVFHASEGPGEYHVYYRPFASCEFADGGSCAFGAAAEYAFPGSSGGGGGSCVDGSGWWPATAAATFGRAGIAAVQSQQGRTAFSATGPMEQAATRAEVAALAAAAGSPVALLFSEDRANVVRMRHKLPAAWAARDPADLARFAGEAQPGEAYTLQLAVHALSADVSVQAVTFSDLESGSGEVIPADAMRCMNTEGTDWLGRPYVPAAAAPTVRIDQVLPLWVALRVPLDAAPGTYTGSATVTLATDLQSAATLTLNASLSLLVDGPALEDRGDGEPWRGTRLQWLDSTLGQGGSTVPPPFEKLSVTTTPAGGGGLRVQMLDKAFDIGADGMLHSVTVGTAHGTKPTANAVAAEALGAPVALHATADGAALSAAGAALTSTAVSGASTSWTSVWAPPAASSSTSSAAGLSITVNATLDCTGYADYIVTFNNSGPAATPIGDLRVNLTVPNAQANAHMAMGLGMLGGYMEDLTPPAGGGRNRSEWLLLDWGEARSADAIGLFSSADGIHDPSSVEVAVSDATTAGPWRTVLSTDKGVPRAAGRQVFAFGSNTTSRFWKVSFASMVPSGKCAPSVSCQLWLGELQLRDSGSGAWMVNAGTQGENAVIASSGSSSITNAAWKAVDGDLKFIQDSEGWDATDHAPPPPAPGTPTPAPTPRAGLEPFVWRWDGINGNNAVWVGSSAAGLRLFLKGDEDIWQAAVPFDSQSLPPNPRAWSNGGAGGIELDRQTGTATAFTSTPSTAPRALGVGEVLTLRFSIMATPVRPLDLPKHFSERYAQLGGPANYSFLAEQGATIANMHQGNGINPWINYPYKTNTLMQDAAEACHKSGIKFKIYNTMRELSNRCDELFAMNAFNETLVLQPGTVDPGALPPVGHGADWLQEHLVTGYTPAWSNPVQNTYPGSTETAGIAAGMEKWVDHAHEQDAAVKVKALSRWNNYYVEGLRQMVADFDFDGLYLDEIAYDRVTIMRAKAVLGADRLIDHHSDKGGFTPSPATNYLELYPFIDSLWYGEGFDYDGSLPAYWLLEIGGVALGLNSDMLRYEGMTPKHFHGMLFGNANRWQCSLDGPVGGCPFDPRAVWRLWEDFGISNGTHTYLLVLSPSSTYSR